MTKTDVTDRQPDQATDNARKQDTRGFFEALYLDAHTKVAGSY